MCEINRQKKQYIPVPPTEKSIEELELQLAQRYIKLPKLDDMQMLFYHYVERKRYDEAMKDALVKPDPDD